MSDDTIEYLFTAPWDGAGGQGEIQDIAARFGTGYHEIVKRSAGRPWLASFGESVRLFAGSGLDDGDVLDVPLNETQWRLDGDAQWTEWQVNDGDNLQMILDVVKGGSPVGKLIPIWAYPGDGTFGQRVNVGATPRVSTLSLVWYYYKNSRLRRDTLKSSGRRDTDADNLSDFPNLRLDASSAKTIWLPLIPPLRVSVPVAPSSPAQPKTGATVDVRPNDKFNALAKALGNLEIQLNGIDMNRGEIASVKRDGEAILNAFRDLRESMQTRMDEWESASQMAAVNKMPDPDSQDGKAARASALSSLDTLITKATRGIGSPAAWIQILGDGKIGDVKPARDVTHATQAVRNLIDGAKEGAAMMSLLTELCPDMYDAPLRDRKGNRTTLLDYVCGLATRAATALSNSEEADDITFIWSVADGYTTNALPGPGCASLIEYACACANGFKPDDSILLFPTTSPQQCLSVVLTIRFGKDLDAIAPDVEVKEGGRLTASTAAKTVARLAAGVALSKVKPLLVRMGLAKESDPPEGLVKTLKESYELYKARAESLESGTKALELAKYDQKTLGAFLCGFLIPYTHEKESIVGRILPKGMKGFLPVLTVLWDVAGAETAAGEGADKVQESWASTVEGSADISKALGDATSATLEGAKALKLFAKTPDGKLLAFGEGAELTIKVLGRASFLLGAVSESVEIYQTEKDGKIVEMSGHILGAAGYVCLFVASVGGAPVFVAVGTGLLLGDVILTKGNFVVELLKGETVEKYEAITKAPDQESMSTEETKKAKSEHALAYIVKKWASAIKFIDNLDAFKATFELADFTAVSAEIGSAASASPTLLYAP